MQASSESATPTLPMLVIEHEKTAPIARLGDWLVEAGAQLVVRLAADGALPADLSGYSALIVMGGSQNANDDVNAPWLPAVRRLIATAVADEVPMLGVCLGGQLLAVATGGRVERAPRPEYGAHLVAKRQAAADDPLFRSLPITPDVIQWHVDEVTELPPGAQLLASSPGGEVQAFRVGKLAWGTQFHLETTPQIVHRWAADDAEELADYDVDTLLSRSDAIEQDMADVWQPFTAAFVRLAAEPEAAWSGSSPAGRPLLAMATGHHHPETVAEPITDPIAIRAALAAEMQAAREPYRD